MPEDSKDKHYFGPKFFWGASTSGHQVEGYNQDQWTVWELSHAAELSHSAARRLGKLGSWHNIKDQAQKPQNYVSGRGIEHFTRYKQDFKLLKDLNLNSYRFGIEWSRLQPESGKWDEEAIQHYHGYIDELKKQGIEPFLNLWHWTLPIWFTDMGGFKKASNLKFFDKFVEKVAQEYGTKVKHIITLNEPNVYASVGYFVGQWPPGEKSIASFIAVYFNLTRAHNRAYKMLKSYNPKLQIGVASQLANIQAKRPHNMVDQTMTKWMRYFWNWWFINRIRRHQDFVGFNYYFTDYYKYFKREDPKVPLSDMGWYMEPEGIYPLLLRVWAHYKKPIIITENGLADAEDKSRRWWIEETMVAMERAMSEGVDLRGYFHWSLLDNFEWAEGYWPKFGLIAVNRSNMKRTVRPSAKWWANWLYHVQHNGTPKL